MHQAMTKSFSPSNLVIISFVSICILSIILNHFFFLKLTMKKMDCFARLHRRSLLSPQLCMRSYKMCNPNYVVQLDTPLFCYVLPILRHTVSSCLVWSSSINWNLFCCHPPLYRHECPLYHRTNGHDMFSVHINSAFCCVLLPSGLFRVKVLKIMVGTWYGKTCHCILSREWMSFCSVLIAIRISILTL